MNEDYEYTSPEEEALLDLIRKWTDKLPKTNTWIAHPVNYPRATKAISRILEIIRKESPDAEHRIVFDELIGTGMSLMVKDWVYSFYGCKEIAEAISLADSFDIDATIEGEIWLHFGFENTRIPIFLKHKDSEES